MVLIFNSMVDREISGTNLTRVRLSGQYHSASPRAILLPLNLTLVKFIPNFTPTRAITYTYIYIPHQLEFVHPLIVSRSLRSLANKCMWSYVKLCMRMLGGTYCGRG